jgi:hypothetical protein
MPSDFEVGWISDFKAIAVANFNGCTDSTLFLGAYINRINWRNMLNGGTLPLPYFVMDIGAEEESTEWSPMDGDTWMVPVDTYAVYSFSDPLSSIANNGNAPYDPVGYAISQAYSFRQGLLGYLGSNFNIYPETKPIIDASRAMEVNAIFSIENAPLWAVKIGSHLLVGETN